MFRTLTPLFLRTLPLTLKSASLALTFLYLNSTYRQTSISCLTLPGFSHPATPGSIFAEIMPKIIRIENGGEIVGYAYCYAENGVVSAWYA